MNLILSDHELFRFLNLEFVHPVLDQLFIFIFYFPKSPIFVYFVVPTLLVLAYRAKKIIGPLLVVTGVFGAFLADEAVTFLKNLVERPRPIATELGYQIALRCGEQGGFSFPSGHATTSFFMAAFCSVFFRRGRVLFFLFAFLVSYSRVYCGFHFPIDVIAGAMFGGGFGYLSAKLLSQIPFFKMERK